MFSRDGKTYQLEIEPAFNEEPAVNIDESESDKNQNGEQNAEAPNSDTSTDLLCQSNEDASTLNEIVENRDGTAGTVDEGANINNAASTSNEIVGNEGMAAERESKDAAPDIPSRLIAATKENEAPNSPEVQNQR